jgi:hypothetical protein
LTSSHTDKDSDGFTPTDSFYISSALGNAYESGLTFEEVFNASSTVYMEEEDSLNEGEYFFDAPWALGVAVCATIALNLIVQEYYSGPTTTR